MGNCCRSPAAVAREDVSSSHFPATNNAKKKPHQPRNGAAGGGGGQKRLAVLGEEGCEVTGIDDKYVLDRELGRGEFGVTYLCMDRDTKELLACKSISKRKLRTAVDVEDVRREVAIMRHLPKSPSIVTLREACEDEGAVHLVMELCEGGELFDRIVARGHYTERAAANVTRTIVEVVQLCHRHGVIHRDLKPENFLFANKKENSPLKAIDFGLSIFFKPGEKFSEIVGSPYYMAPEVLKRNYGPEIDIWSAGVILYILLCGVPPFWAETEQGVAQAILRGNIDFKREPWPNVSDNAKDLVRHMLEPDPKLRLTAKQVLEHPWLQNAKKAPNVPLGDIVKSRLKQFSRMNRFKRRALRVIADHLSAEGGEDPRAASGDSSRREKKAPRCAVVPLLPPTSYLGRPDSVERHRSSRSRRCSASSPTPSSATASRPKCRRADLTSTQIMDSWEDEVRRFMLQEEEEDDELFLVMVSALQLSLYDEKIPEHTSSLSGAERVKEILEGHERWCKVEFMMESEIFRAIAHFLRVENLLRDTCGVKIEEQLGCLCSCSLIMRAPKG